MIANNQITEEVQFESGSSNRGQFGVGVNLPLIAFHGRGSLRTRYCATTQEVTHRTEQYIRTYFENLGTVSTDQGTDQITDQIRRNNANPSASHDEKRICVDALGAGGQRFESSHLDTTKAFRVTPLEVFFVLGKSPYCSVSNLINNPNRDAYFGQLFLSRVDQIGDHVQT